MRDTTRPLILSLLVAMILGAIVLLYSKISPKFEYTFESVIKSNAKYYPEVPVPLSLSIEAEDMELPADGESSTTIYVYVYDARKQPIKDHNLVFKAKYGTLTDVEQLDDDGYAVEYIAPTKPVKDTVKVVDKSSFRRLRAQINIDIVE